MKKKVLIFAGFYLPSVKGGGPIQSIKNIVDHLSDHIEFYIVAADRDLGDKKAFESICVDKWIKVESANVWYTNLPNLSWNKTTNIMDSIDFDYIYLNSFFSYKFSIRPILINKIKRKFQKPVILAPRGQFSPGALDLKSKKKELYIKISKILRIYKNVLWHATADLEKNDIEEIIGENENIKVANNLTENYKELKYEKLINKIPGELKIIFLSRIHPKKNLKQAIEIVSSLNGKVEFNIFGPLEDELYWKDCEALIKKIPKNIKINYKGILNHNEIQSVFKSHHVFLFPTLGENFGHVISEALIGGCPVIVSDQTPWRDLEEKSIGWDIELKNISRYIEVMQKCVNLNEEDYERMSIKSFCYSKNMSNRTEDITNAISLFD